MMKFVVRRKRDCSPKLISAVDGGTLGKSDPVEPRTANQATAATAAGDNDDDALTRVISKGNAESDTSSEGWGRSLPTCHRKNTGKSDLTENKSPVRPHPTTDNYGGFKGSSVDSDDPRKTVTTDTGRNAGSVSYYAVKLNRCVVLTP